MKTHIGMSRAKTYCGKPRQPRMVDRPDLALEHVTCRTCLKSYRYWENMSPSLTKAVSPKSL
jgi:hypothetical protein